jgi:hypothetical protein
VNQQENPSSEEKNQPVNIDPKGKEKGNSVNAPHEFQSPKIIPRKIK